MKLLSDLIGINTYEGNYTEMIDYLVKRLEAIDDCKVHIQRISENKTNVIGIFGKPEIVLNCHMDTVKPSNAWSQDPLSMYEKDGRIYGLGSCDTKGNIYMVLKAIERAKPEDLMVLFSVDEESGVKTGVKYFLESELVNGIKRAVVFEPTELKLVNKHRGYYSFTLEDVAESAHSSTKAKGAIIKAAHNVIRLDELGFNVGIIEGGTAGNVVSQRCTYRASIRTFESLESILDIIKSNCVDTRIENRFNGPPLINGDPKFDGEFHEVDFWTEGSLFQEAGINTVVFGAGSIRQAHSEDEFVEKWQLEKGIELIKEII
ncbi:M20 family metallopeptidase [Gudongella oleilytica]|uniref:M20 family metallopeptidase n=1 Tax=Gudongella oleilytica TaxID=1582259 RepID=UPI000FF87EC9|nr:M20/M25/M40 family metallo-hydrolase [Gudongella oleilytica]